MAIRTTSSTDDLAGFDSLANKIELFESQMFNSVIKGWGQVHYVDRKHSDLAPKAPLVLL